MPVDLDVVVDVDPGLLPLGEHVALGRERAKGGTLELLEQRAPRPRELAERARVEPFEQPGDGGVELGEREERSVAKRGQDPALYDLHGDLHLRLVPRAPGPRRQHRHAVVVGQVVVGGVDVRLVAVGAAHGRAQVVRDHQLRTAPEELERANMRCRPVGKGLRPGRLGEGIARRPEHGDEHLRLALLAGLAVHHRDRLTGVVHEHLLARTVLLAHHHVERRRERPVPLAELAVLQSLGVGRLVLVPQQREGDSLATKLAVDLAPVRQRTARPARRRSREQPVLKLPIVERLRQRPAKTLHLGPADVLAHRRGRRLHASGNRPNAHPAAWYSRRTSRILRMDNLRFATVGPPSKPGRVPQMAGCPASLSSRSQDPCSVPARTEKVIGSHRNHCPVCSGIGDRFAPESVIGMDGIGDRMLRNPQKPADPECTRCQATRVAPSRYLIPYETRLSTLGAPGPSPLGTAGILPVGAMVAFRTARAGSPRSQAAVPMGIPRPRRALLASRVSYVVGFRCGLCLGSRLGFSQGLRGAP